MNPEPNWLLLRTLIKKCNLLGMCHKNGLSSFYFFFKEKKKKAKHI